MDDVLALGEFPIDQAVAGARGEPHVAYATYEILPGGATGHRPGLQAASDAEKDAYSREPLASWAARKAILWSLVPESFKPVSDETWAEYNRRMTWYMQHPEYVGRMDLPSVGGDAARDVANGLVDGLTLFAPAGEGLGLKLAGGFIPMARALLRGAAGEAERAGAETLAKNALPRINWHRDTVGERNWPLKPGYKVVEVPTDRLHRAWANTEQPESVLEAPKNQVLDYARSGQPMSLPEVSYDPSNQRIAFDNGRNRFLASSVLGEKTTPVATNRANADQFVDFVNKFELPMDEESRHARARQIGFRTHSPLYLGTNEIIEALSSGPTTAAEHGAPGVSTLVDPAAASEFAERTAATYGGQPQVVKLWYRADHPYAIDLAGGYSHSQVVETLRDLFEKGHDAVILRNYTTPGGLTGQRIVVVRDANQLRSPHAAFDRSQKLSPNLLAGLAGGAVAVPAADFMRQGQQ